MEYKPIRIIADITVPVGTRKRAERNYPHGTINCITTKSGRNLPAYSVSYWKPQRIDAPTPEERQTLLNAQSAEGQNYALEIPQHKDLGCDDPASPLSGSRTQAKHRQRKARLEELDRQDARKLEALEAPPPVPEPAPVVDPETKPDQNKSKRSYKKEITEVKSDE